MQQNGVVNIAFILGEGKEEESSGRIFPFYSIGYQKEKKRKKKKTNAYNCWYHSCFFSLCI
jgi:hypothetical protein